MEEFNCDGKRSANVIESGIAESIREHKLHKSSGYQLGLVFLGLSGLAQQRAQKCTESRTQWKEHCACSQIRSMHFRYSAVSQNCTSQLNPFVSYAFVPRPGWLERSPDYEFIIQAESTVEQAFQSRKDWKKCEEAQCFMRLGRWQKGYDRVSQLHPSRQADGPLYVFHYS